MKWLVFLLMASVGLTPSAGAQIVPLQTSDDLAGDAIETTTDTLGSVLADSTDALSETASVTEQTAIDPLDSSTASDGTSASTDSTASTEESASEPSPRSSRGRADGSASPGEEFRSRFDRLPPRLERLLERIELGRNVPANLRRLEQALASLSVRERARLLQLLNAEIRRLRSEGVSPAERRRIDRLMSARATITALSGPTSISFAADASRGRPATALAPGTDAPFAGGVLGGSGSEAPASDGATPPSGGSVSPSGPSGILDGGGFPLTEVLLAVGAVLLVIFGGLAAKEERAW